MTKLSLAVGAVMLLAYLSPPLGDWLRDRHDGNLYWPRITVTALKPSTVEPMVIWQCSHVKITVNETSGGGYGGTFK